MTILPVLSRCLKLDICHLTEIYICGGRLIGPMDGWDVKALSEAMNVALSGEHRHGTPQCEEHEGWA